MGSKINRGFMFYLLLLLGILLGAFLICVVIMIFVPDFSLFGIKCFNENLADRVTNMSVYSDINDTEKNGTVALSDTSYVIENIEIVSTSHSVQVFKSNNSQGVNYGQFVLIYSSKAFGFTTEDVSNSTLSINYYLDTKTLKIEATSPEGFLTFGNARTLCLQIPPTYSTSNINLIVDTGRSVTIGDSDSSPSNTSHSTLDLKTINLSANGTVKVTNCTNIGATTRGDCSITAGSATVTVNTIIRANDLSIVAGETTLKFNEDDQSFDLTGDLSIETNNTFVYLGTITANNISLKSLYGKFYFKKDITGNIYIDKDSKKCDYEMLNITGAFTAGSYLDELMIDGGNIIVDGAITGEISIASTGYIYILKKLWRSQILRTYLAMLQLMKHNLLSM